MKKTRGFILLAVIMVITVCATIVALASVGGTKVNAETASSSDAAENSTDKDGTLTDGELQNAGTDEINLLASGNEVVSLDKSDLSVGKKLTVSISTAMTGTPAFKWFVYKDDTAKGTAKSEDPSYVITSSDYDSWIEAEVYNSTGQFVGSDKVYFAKRPVVYINAGVEISELYKHSHNDVDFSIQAGGDYSTSFSVGASLRVVSNTTKISSDYPYVVTLDEEKDIFGFGTSKAWLLLPDGFADSLKSALTGVGYSNPAGLTTLNHARVNLIVNGGNSKKYDLYEYSAVYYLNCYEGILGGYYYYDPANAGLDDATMFWLSNEIMGRNYTIASEYYWKGLTGVNMTFKPTWPLNYSSLSGTERDSYISQWVSFPYFIVKATEQYWKVRDSILDSTYAETNPYGYYEMYGYYGNYGSLQNRILVMDQVFKTEETALNGVSSSVAAHPYKNSDKITISGNYASDTITPEDNAPASGVISSDTKLILNIRTADTDTSSFLVYLNGEKYVGKDADAIYDVTDGNCTVTMEPTELSFKNGDKNIISVVALDKSGKIRTDESARVMTEYVSIKVSDIVAKNIYTVSFVSNGGTPVSSQSVDEGEKANIPTTPKKGAFTFEGWYTDINLTTRYDFNTPVLGNITLYARWYFDRTAGGSGGSGGSGGGSGSGGGGGNSSFKGNPVPLSGSPSVSMISGIWNNIGGRWTFTESSGNKSVGKWAYVKNPYAPAGAEKADWFCFDSNGFMKTGWYTDITGDTFYLNEESDGTMGKMVTGWRWLKDTDGKYYAYYFETRSNGRRGALYRSTTTPDGYEVNGKGQWVVDGIAQSKTFR